MQSSISFLLAANKERQSSLTAKWILKCERLMEMPTHEQLLFGIK